MTDTISIPQLDIDQLSCALCREALSCSPIRVLPDGRCICGLCTPSSFVPVYHVPLLEEILKKLTFPCKFKQYGCAEGIPFGKGRQHELHCIYQTIICPIWNCSWKGRSLDVNDHFVEKHVENVKEKFEFQLDLKQSCQKEVDILVTSDCFKFIVKYLYDVKTKALKYYIQQFASNIQENFFCKIQLISGSDSELSITLKEENVSFYETSKDKKTLHLGKYLGVLGNPDSLLVCISLEFIKPEIEVKEVAVVEKNVLDCVRCENCKYYIIPPVFDAEINETQASICYECSRHFPDRLESEDAGIRKLIDELDYPCRWVGCNFSNKSSLIQIHNLTCNHRVYRCFMQSCNHTYSIGTANTHLRSSHSYYVKHLPDRIHQVKFSTENSVHVYIIKGNILFAINMMMVRKKENNEMVLNSILLSDCIKISVPLQFKHQHCKLKSEIFELVSDEQKTITLKDMPSCFTAEDSITVVVGDCYWKDNRF